MRFYPISEKNFFVPHEHFIEEYIRGRFPVRIIHEYLVHLPTIFRRPPELIERHAKVIEKAYGFAAWIEKNQPGFFRKNPKARAALLDKISGNIDSQTAVYKKLRFELGSIADRAKKLILETELDPSTQEQWDALSNRYAKFLAQDPSNTEIPETFRDSFSTEELYKQRSKAMGADSLPDPFNP